jgi:hypothetical protein
MIMSILGCGIIDISNGEIDSDSHRDEHGGISTVINMTHEKLVGLEVMNFQFFHGIRESIWLVGCFIL